VVLRKGQAHRHVGIDVDVCAAPFSLHGSSKERIRLNIALLFTVGHYLDRIKKPGKELFWPAFSRSGQTFVFDELEILDF
jgi:hypothetical protein